MLEIRHDAATREAYDEIYSDEGILLRDSFYLWLISLLQPERGKILLDISCGQGRLVKLAQGKGLQAMGIDFAMSGVRKGWHESPGSGWAVGDGECLPLAESSVDYVTHIGSLEHYLNPEAGVREICRVLKPGAKACILLPNAFGLLGNVRHVLKHGEIFDDGQPLQRYATRRTWESLLQNGGLRLLKIVRYGEVEVPRTSRDLFWLLSRPHKVIKLLITGLIPTNLCNHFVFMCTHD